MCEYIYFLRFFFTGCGHWIEKPIEQDQFSLYQRDPKISTLPKMPNFAAPYCKRVRYVGILRFHNILSTIMSSLFSWARQPNYLSHALLFCCNHYLLNLMGRFWFFSLSQLVLRCYNIVKTESVLKTENTFKVLFLNVVLNLYSHL